MTHSTFNKRYTLGYESALLTWHGSKFLHIGFVRTPCGTGRVLHAFHAPQEIKYSQIAQQAIGCKNLKRETIRQRVYLPNKQNQKTNSFKWTVHIVIQREHIPTHVVRRVLGERKVKKAKLSS